MRSHPQSNPTSSRCVFPNLCTGHYVYCTDMNVLSLSLSQALVKGSHALIVPYVGHLLGSLMKLLSDPSSSLVGAALSTIGQSLTPVHQLTQMTSSVSNFLLLQEFIFRCAGHGIN